MKIIDLHNHPTAKAVFIKPASNNDSRMIYLLDADGNPIDVLDEVELDEILTAEEIEES